MIKGSCLCQGVKYEYQGIITEVAVCHCNQCKRAQGTPFAINAPIKSANFVFVQGDALLKEYFSSTNKKRVFCSNCGSPIFSQRIDMLDTIRLRLGTVTEGEIPEPSYEIYCESESGWYDFSHKRYRYQGSK